MTILVLPFENLTRKNEDEWLGVGLAEAIQMKLSTVEGLRVVGWRTSVDGMAIPTPRFAVPGAPPRSKQGGPRDR